ncbi:MAG: hypothetical protein ACM3ZC_07930 [Bacteroidota bacterium]
MTPARQRVASRTDTTFPGGTRYFMVPAMNAKGESLGGRSAMVTVSAS